MLHSWRFVMLMMKLIRNGCPQWGMLYLRIMLFVENFNLINLTSQV